MPAMNASSIGGLSGSSSVIGPPYRRQAICLQIELRMGAETGEDQPVIVNEPVDQHQVGLYMAVPIVLPVAGQGMIPVPRFQRRIRRSEEHTSELQSLMRISYAVFCLKKKKQTITTTKSSNYQEILITATTYISI